MPYQPAADLTEASQKAVNNTTFADDDVGEDLRAVLEDFRDKFFGLYNASDPEQKLLLRWVIPLQHTITLTNPGTVASRNHDAWRSGFSISAACTDAEDARLNGKISNDLANDLLAAYNSAFS